MYPVDKLLKKQKKKNKKKKTKKKKKKNKKKKKKKKNSKKTDDKYCLKIGTERVKRVLKVLLNRTCGNGISFTYHYEYTPIQIYRKFHFHNLNIFK